MAKLTPKTLNLSDDERIQLQQLSDRHHRPQQIARLPRIILMASDGQNHREIARNLDINRQRAREGAKSMVGDQRPRLIDFAKITSSRACWCTSKI